MDTIIPRYAVEERELILSVYGDDTYLDELDDIERLLVVEYRNGYPTLWRVADQARISPLAMLDVKAALRRKAEQRSGTR